MILCTMPRCQTSAGCVCVPYVPPFTPSEADQHYSAEIASLRAELTRLQKELETAREALEDIASDKLRDDTWPEHYWRLVEVARRSLKDKEVAGG